jgi:multiple sugar transport system permease protein
LIAAAAREEDVSIITGTKRSEYLAAAVLIAPFLVVYGVLFVYPTAQMVYLSFTDAPLIGPGEWVGLKNYLKLFTDRLFGVALWNTFYFILLTVIPGTLLGLLIAMGVNRLSGWKQSVILACFFLPYMLPVSVVFLIWSWIFEPTYGIAQHLILAVTGERIPIFRNVTTFMPFVALVTNWWLVGFNVLLFIAGLRNIPPEIYEAASIDGASRLDKFRTITWPLIWPVTVLVLTIQLIAKLKIFDQVYLFSLGGRTDSTLVMVQFIYRQAFQRNQGGYAASIAVVFFLIVVVLSVLQYQGLRARSAK